MRELFELINEYPWISVFVSIILLIILSGISTFITHVIEILRK